MDITVLIKDFGFPIVMAVGMGYFVYFVYQTIMLKVDPAINDMKITIISLWANILFDFVTIFRAC